MANSPSPTWSTIEGNSRNSNHASFQPLLGESQYIGDLQECAPLSETANRARMASYAVGDGGLPSPLEIGPICSSPKMSGGNKNGMQCFNNEMFSVNLDMPRTRGTARSSTDPTRLIERDEDVSTSSSSFEKFQALFKRQKVHKDTKYDPLDFYADVRLTPIELDKGVFQIISSEPGLRGKNLKWEYTFMYHGRRTHEWSLLRAQHGDNDVPARPIAILNTWSNDVKKNESKIIDLIDPLRAHSFTMAHYWDSYSMNGTHVGFQLDEDNRYEWKSASEGFNTNALYLWRVNMAANSITPVARITTQTLFQSPSDNSTTWCLEVDRDGISEHLALVSAFYLKVSHIKQHSYFAPRNVVLTPPKPLGGFCFQGDKHLYRNVAAGVNKSRASSPTKDAHAKKRQNQEPLVIKVFSGTHLAQYRLGPEVVDALEREMRARARCLKSILSL